MESGINRTRAQAAKPAGPNVTSRCHGPLLVTIQLAAERSEQTTSDTPRIYSGASSHPSASGTQHTRVRAFAMSPRRAWANGCCSRALGLAAARTARAPSMGRATIRRSPRGGWARTPARAHRSPRCLSAGADRLSRCCCAPASAARSPDPGNRGIETGPGTCVRQDGGGGVHGRPPRSARHSCWLICHSHEMPDSPGAWISSTASRASRKPSLWGTPALAWLAWS